MNLPWVFWSIPFCKRILYTGNMVKVQFT